MEETANQIDIREGYNRVLESNQRLDQRIIHPSIDLLASKAIFFVEGNYDQPRIVRVNIEGGGYVTIFVKEDSFGPLTTSEQKATIQWVYASKIQGQEFEATDSTHSGRSIKVDVARHLCGSGLIWCEPFIHEPTNSFPSGFFIQGVCATKIVEAAWIRHTSNNSGRPLPRHHRARYGDLVQFKIRTEGLNGDVISVQFMEDENEEELEFISERTIEGALLIDFPIKREWQMRFFSGIERMFNDYLRITPILRYTNRRGEEVEEEGPELVVENQRSATDAAKGGVVPVGTEQVEIQSAAYHPCRFLEIVFKNKDRNYTYFSQNGNALGEAYHMISGSRDNKKEVLIRATNLDTSECELVSDQHQSDEVSLTYEDISGTTRQETAPVVRGDTAKHEVLSNLSENTFHLIRQIWPEKEEVARAYTYSFQTCRHQLDVPVFVHSDIEWKIAFKWNYQAPLAYAWSHTMQPYSLNRGAIRDIDRNRSLFARPNEALSHFSLTAQASWDGGDSVEVGMRFAERIRRTLGIFNRVRNLVNDISGEFTPSSRTFSLMPMTFEIQSPSIGFAASYKLVEMTEDTPDYVHQVATVGELQIVARPLIGARIVVDLWQAVANLGSPALARIVVWLREKGADYFNTTFEIRINGRIDVSGNLSIHTRAELSEENSGAISFDGLISLEIELSAKAGTGELVGGVFEADVEAGISGTTDIKAGLEVGADKKGVYTLPKGEFGGVVVSYTFKGSVRFGIFTRNWDQSPEDSRLLRSRKIPIEKEDCYLT